MKKAYFGIFHKDVLHPWTCASLASLAKMNAMDNCGYKTWREMTRAGYRLGRLKITEIAPEPIQDKRKKGAK